MTLHVETLAVAAFFVSIALTLALTAVGRLIPDQPGLHRWVQGLWLATCGAILLGLRGNVPDVVPVVGAHALLALSVGLTWAGAREFCERPAPLLPVALVTTAYAAVQATFLVFPSLAVRSANFALMSAGWSLAVAWTFFRHGPQELERSRRLVGLLFLLDALWGCGVLVSKSLDPHALDPVRLHRLEVLNYLEAIVLGTLEVLGFVLLLTHRILVQMGRIARADGLTGILNRRALDEDASWLLEVCHRQRMPCALLMLDLDHFKVLNDTYGHAAGDAALRHVAKLLEGELRRADLLGRYGGEEFCVVVPGSSLEQALAVAERVRAEVERHPVPWVSDLIPVTISAGVSHYDGTGPASYEVLLSEADRALYRAKTSGRNRVSAVE